MVRSAFVFATLSLIASAALAADPQSAKPATPGYDPDERICEKITVTGSRLATHTVCATRSEWDRRRLEERQLIDRSQMAPCVEMSVSGGKAQCRT